MELGVFRHFGTCTQTHNVHSTSTAANGKLKNMYVFFSKTIEHNEAVILKWGKRTNLYHVEVNLSRGSYFNGKVFFFTCSAMFHLPYHSPFCYGGKKLSVHRKCIETLCHGYFGDWRVVYELLYNFLYLHCVCIHLYYIILYKCFYAFNIPVELNNMSAIHLLLLKCVLLCSWFSQKGNIKQKFPSSASAAFAHIKILKRSSSVQICFAIKMFQYIWKPNR